MLIFDGHLGYHGGAADLTQLSKVTQLKQLSRYLSFGYDGGANLGNVGIIKDAGIEVINVGSAIHTVADPASAYAQLVKNVS